MTILEAWAHGLPVLMTDECNLPDGFEAGAAFRIESEPSALAEKLLGVLNDEVGLYHAGARGLSLVSSVYSWKQAAERMHSLYTHLRSEAALLPVRGNAK